MSFKNAYNDTMGVEGGYVFDPTDRGGETYKGISRVYNHNWKGWDIIDSYKPFTNGYNELYSNPRLQKLTENLYKRDYWDKPYLEAVDKLWEKLAEKLFDTGVNVGMGRASKWLQSSLNLLNRNGKYYQDISADGMIGPQTIRILEEAMKCNPKQRILNVFAVHQGEHYKAIMERDKTQERFVGWFDRLTYK